MNARVLTEEQEIIEAKKIAYEVLVKEEKWELPADNPSGLHVKDLPQGKVLWDDYDTVATWLGVFEHNSLVGCLRICRRFKGKFELERYHELPDFIKQDKLAVEGTRLAVRKHYRQSTAVFKLLKLLYKDLLYSNGGYLFGTGFLPNPGKLYVNEFGMTKHGLPFRYHPEDPKEVYLYYINGYDRPNLIEMISKFERLLKLKLPSG
ncbi:MAG: GNAT family N-acetyltransferase [Moorea sp. SIO1G6]|uniref:GNAT family N-acyltransferase n=1 Tax=Moorena sp. SIO1G6 TaxID=2607840 RepID=UPI0013C03A99|nr:GNAT family N-acyltransferase [Moorena sp. SIO1G6]NES83401.1 GNAT family N-acetyltransferase [Moorena sp. SIO2B7]NET66943.1 GNAT family N-acetyltransferase [Moorena sp. SIO1G6]